MNANMPVVKVATLVVSIVVSVMSVIPVAQSATAYIRPPNDAIQGVLPTDPNWDPLLNVGWAIENHDCDTVESAFNADNIDTTAPQAGEPIASLKLNTRLLNAARGLEMGVDALTFANFFNMDPFAAAPDAAPDRLSSGR